VDKLKPFLGWSFPPSFDSVKGVRMILEEQEDIVQSLHLLFSTQLNERVFYPTYGNSIQPFTYDSIDARMNQGLVTQLKKMISINEPRIIVEDCFLSLEDNSILKIQVVYSLTEDPDKHTEPYLFETPFIL